MKKMAILMYPIDMILGFVCGEFIYNQAISFGYNVSNFNYTIIPFSSDRANQQILLYKNDLYADESQKNKMSLLMKK